MFSLDTFQSLLLSLAGHTQGESHRVGGVWVWLAEHWCCPWASCEKLQAKHLQQLIYRLLDGGYNMVNKICLPWLPSEHYYLLLYQPLHISSLVAHDLMPYTGQQRKGHLWLCHTTGTPNSHSQGLTFPIVKNLGLRKVSRHLVLLNTLRVV